MTTAEALAAINALTTRPEDMDSTQLLIARDQLTSQIEHSERTGKTITDAMNRLRLMNKRDRISRELKRRGA